MSASVIMGQFYLPSSSVLSSQPTSLNKLSRLQINKVRELYLSGKDAPPVLSRIGLRVILERDVVQLAALCFPDQPVIKYVAQNPCVAFPIVAV